MLMMASDSCEVASLAQWANANRIEVDDGLELCHSDSAGITVRSKDETFYSASNILVRIPKSAVLSTKSSLLSDHIISAIPFGHGAHLALSLVLYYETLLGKQSRWSGYIESLPTELVDIAYLWGCDSAEVSQNDDSRLLRANDAREALTLLKGSELEKALRGSSNYDGAFVLEEVIDYFHTVAAPLLSRLSSTILDEARTGDYRVHQNVTLGGFFHAYGLVSSRAFLVDAYHGLAMVPIADAFNHDQDNHVHLETDYDVCPTCGSLQECIHDTEDEDDGSKPKYLTNAENNTPRPIPPGQRDEKKNQRSRTDTYASGDDIAVYLDHQEEITASRKRKREIEGSTLREGSKSGPRDDDWCVTIKNFRGEADKMFDERRSRPEPGTKTPDIRNANCKLGAKKEASQKLNTVQNLVEYYDTDTSGSGEDTEESTSAPTGVTLPREQLKIGKSRPDAGRPSSASVQSKGRVPTHSNFILHSKTHGSNVAKTTSEIKGRFPGRRTQAGDDRDEQWLEMVCVAAISPGEQVFNTYGTLSNAQLLAQYGFMLDENEHDVVSWDEEQLASVANAYISSLGRTDPREPRELVVKRVLTQFRHVAGAWPMFEQWESSALVYNSTSNFRWDSYDTDYDANHESIPQPQINADGKVSHGLWVFCGVLTLVVGCWCCGERQERSRLGEKETRKDEGRSDERCCDADGDSGVSKTDPSTAKGTMAVGAPFLACEEMVARLRKIATLQSILELAETPLEEDEMNEITGDFREVRKGEVLQGTRRLKLLVTGLARTIESVCLYWLSTFRLENVEMIDNTPEEMIKTRQVLVLLMTEKSLVESCLSGWRESGFLGVL